MGARKSPMMAGFQAEENLTGRAQKNVRKILDVISAAETLEDQACALLYVLACGDPAHQIPVQPTFLSVIDVVDVCCREAKLRPPVQLWLPFFSCPTE